MIDLWYTLWFALCGAVIGWTARWLVEVTRDTTGHADQTRVWTKTGLPEMIDLSAYRFKPTRLYEWSFERQEWVRKEQASS